MVTRSQLAPSIVGLTLIVASGCSLRHPAVKRASNEFQCPPADIVERPRPDLGYDVIDVRACGQVARYNCIPRRRYPTICVREPIDDDAVAHMLALPSPPRTEAAPATPTVPPPPDNRRVCRDRRDFDGSRDCVYVPGT